MLATMARWVLPSPRKCWTAPTRRRSCRAWAGWRVYDSYLKANRVEAGAASYAEVVRLVLGARLASGGAPLSQ